MSKKLNMISLGCAKNLVDSEILLGGLKNQNVDIVENPEQADAIVI
ncbi:MAG: 30S ribosomal protein S12 methylthiotransferase RimO, partial [Candidatus Marinimicrobia bacterium]|nr:30S ribosomal protein S12 methylthiotransferase RimO [Candidatus Neomarinimicrobiota bacterium]MBT5355420.1 30S ribosomal protein S12 methylthiotransferase RimO [Candidatus Neomarinimicrobiota bacterium]MBT5405202.1 30S ribosomal protein S12 methylthiotransferase RimO [Candidatus Neomarinimicrobiota bacterium]MBT7358705.1 30S ribosomal protein S12 methylthiotransferase RimO [Candidatus Neomarinimicrobiota bacterium]